MAQLARLPGAGGEDNQHVFRNALLSAGILHIDDHLTKEVDTALLAWGKFKAGLIQLPFLLGVSHHRERFVYTCLRTQEGFAHCERAFKKNCHTTISWRWGAVVL